MNEKRAPEDQTLAIVAHIAPFVAWLFLMQMLGDPAGWKYAVRAVLSLGLFLGLRPWRWYGAPRMRGMLLAVPAGVFVFAIWVLPESPWMGRVPALQEFYLRWAVMPFGALPEPVEATPYAPAVCGWALTLVKLAGSAFVIAVIEEFFWRGFIYRWMLARDFRSVDPGTLHIGMLVGVSLVFGFEHYRWLAGFMAGLVYAGVMIRTRDLGSACVAHVVTNLLLGIYVVATGSWQFW